MISGSSRRDDQKPGNVIANDQFASPTDLEMTSAFGPWRTRAVRCTCLLLAHRVISRQHSISVAFGA
jgi:hypothetical protein